MEGSPHGCHLLPFPLRKHDSGIMEGSLHHIPWYLLPSPSHEPCQNMAKMRLPQKDIPIQTRHPDVSSSDWGLSTMDKLSPGRLGNYPNHRTIHGQVPRAHYTEPCQDAQSFHCI